MKGASLKLADNKKENSLATKLRRKRFEFFLQLIREVPKPIKILDIGGTQNFWNMMSFSASENVQIVLLNKEKIRVNSPYFSSVIGDATNLSTMENNSFSVVFSNSVIEHVGDFGEQKKMASEVMRVGQHFFIQTPSFYFPLEPHFLFPGFQWLPFSARVWLIRHFSLGHIKAIKDVDKAEEIIRSIRLLTEKELMQLFPTCKIYREKFFGITKSYVAYSEDW